MKNRIICCAMCLVMLVGCLCGCSEAEKVNKNISKQANYFETERHITVYNARTDKVILEAEGLNKALIFYSVHRESFVLP